MSAPQGGGQSAASIGKLLLVIAVLSAGAVFAYKKYGIGKGIMEQTYIPKEMQITYMPADFKMNLDEDKVLRILLNPGRYRSEFDEMVYDLNMSILQHVAARMNLPDSLHDELETEYRRHHNYLKTLYFNDILAIRDTSAAVYEQWYANDAAKAVAALNEVAAKYTCFLVNQVMLALVKSQDGMIAGKGRKVDTPCSIAMQEALKPVVARLQDRAAIQDFSRSKGLIEQRVEQTIAELATMEVRDKKAMNKELKTKLFGYSVSSTEIEISAISVMKIGFKLDEYFNVNVDSKNKTVTVYLPDAKILSHEVYPKVDKLDVGWLRELNSSDFNKNFNALRAEFRREAQESDVFDKARQHASDLIQLMMGPVVSGVGGGKYKLKVRFNKASDGFEEDAPTIDERRQTDAPSNYSQNDDYEAPEPAVPRTKPITPIVPKEQKKAPEKKKPANYIPY
jgi:hypothetical protein